MDSTGRILRWVHRSLTFAALLVAGCAAPARPAASPGEDLEVCSSAAPGTSCRLPIEEGADHVTSLCTKKADGSLVCDSPDVPVGGPRISTNAAEDYGPR